MTIFVALVNRRLDEWVASDRVVKAIASADAHDADAVRSLRGSMHGAHCRDLGIAHTQTGRTKNPKRKHGAIATHGDGVRGRVPVWRGVVHG